jgi:2-dehydro-3-deoxygluconokinase
VHPAALDALDALAIGEAMAVLSPDPPVPLRHAATLSMSMAGAEVNVIMHLAALGLRTAFRSRVGDDPFGQLIGDRLGAAGVEADVCIDPLAPTGIYLKNPGPTGTAVHYYRAGSAASTMDTSIWTSCPPARLVHLSGITTALSPSCAGLVSDGLIRRPVPDAIMSFDINYRPRLWPPAVAGPVLAAQANHADVVFVGLDEAAALWGTTSAAAVRTLIDRPGQLVVKDGAVGATLFTAAGPIFEPAMAIDIVEPVGAGDAFAAGYLYGLLSDRPAAERLRMGHLLAGAAMRTTADVGAPISAADLLSLRRESDEL